MPPKCRIDRERILNQAFVLARKDGFESLTVRGLAASLGCSTQPIYDAFADRGALEAAVAQRAFAFMLQSLRESPEPNVPPDAATALGYIRFALEEGHLFRLIAQNGLFAAPPSPAESPAAPTDSREAKVDGLAAEAAPSTVTPEAKIDAVTRVHAPDTVALPDPRLVIFANGILFMALHGTLPADWPSIRALVLSARSAFRESECPS